ncbi:MAG: hypothetical protein Q8O54_04395 [Brevundimonas sp.]|nr:hypothetical protein [Brevundimonas sp.]
MLRWLQRIQWPSVTGNGIVAFAAAVSAAAAAISAISASTAVRTATHAKVFEMQVESCLALEDLQDALVRQAADIQLDVGNYVGGDRNEGYFTYVYTEKVSSYLSTVQRLRTARNKLDILTRGRTEVESAALTNTAYAFPTDRQPSSALLVLESAKKSGERFGHLEEAINRARKTCMREITRIPGEW